MGSKISKNLLYQILFGICVGITYFNNYELTFAVWIFTIMLTIRNTYSFTLLKYISSFIAILVIAFASSFFYEHNTYDAIRDVTYLIKPIIGFLVGYQLCRSHDIKPFETIIYTGVAIALVHLTIIFHSVLVYKIINIHALRHRAGYFSDFEVYALILALFHKQLNVVLSRQRFWLIVLILAFSSFLYLSRTNFIQFGILFIGLKGYFKLTKKAIIVFSTFLAFTLVGYTVIYNMNLSRNGKGLEALLFKIRNAPIEPFKTKVDKDDWQDFNDNYRSFENINTVRQVSNEGTSAIIFGKGLGATMDIGRLMPTNEGTFVRQQPILHNGFMTVFLKAGIVGVFFLILFTYDLCRQKKSEIEIVKQVNLILLSTGIFLFMANWVLLGLFLKLDNKAIIIGFLLCYKEIITRKANTTDALDK